MRHEQIYYQYCDTGQKATEVAAVKLTEEMDLPKKSVCDNSN